MNDLELINKRNILKENIEEFLFFIFGYLFLLVFLFPALFINFEINEESFTYSLSFVNALFGGKDLINMGSVTFNPSIFLILGFILILIALIITFIGWVINNKKIKKIIYVISISSTLISLLIFYFSKELILFSTPSIINISNYDGVENNYYYLVYISITLVGMILSLLRKVLDGSKYNISQIIEISMLIALALVLDKIKIPMGASGGSINASALPLILLAFRHGFIKGLISSSIIFGFLSCLFDGYGLHTYPFDYLIAFSGYAFIGLFMKLFKKENTLSLSISILLTGIVSLITRYLGGSLSSIIYYDLSFVEALIYQSSYVPGSVILSTILSLLLVPSLLMINKRFPVKKFKNNQLIKEN